MCIESFPLSSPWLLRPPPSPSGMSMVLWYTSCSSSRFLSRGHGLAAVRGDSPPSFRALPAQPSSFCGIHKIRGRSCMRSHIWKVKSETTVAVITHAKLLLLRGGVGKSFSKPLPPPCRAETTRFSRCLRCTAPGPRNAFFMSHCAEDALLWPRSRSQVGNSLSSHIGPSMNPKVGYRCAPLLCQPTAHAFTSQLGSGRIVLQNCPAKTRPPLPTVYLHWTSAVRNSRRAG